jgi:hypothetical protein
MKKEILPERQRLIDLYKPEGYEFIGFFNPADDEAYYMIEEYKQNDNFVLLNVYVNTPTLEIMVYRRHGEIESLVRKAIQEIRRRL